jgi:hypothetical protein
MRLKQILTNNDYGSVELELPYSKSNELAPNFLYHNFVLPI